MKNLSLRKTIRTIREETGIGWEILEQDYVLSWMLFGISNVAPLKSSLIFKGGTALKKCYFGNYRFSQDLDFSVHGKHPKGDELLNLIDEACRCAAMRMDDIEFKCNRYPEKESHPEEQEAFVIHARLPWQRDFNTSIKIEVTTQEHVLMSPVMKQVIHEYGEELNAEIMTYPVEEIIAEKIRAIRQYTKKLHERGWGRSRVRDYYDLWRIFNEYGKSIDIKILPDLVQRKCLPKNVTFTSTGDLFEDKLLMTVRSEWVKWLSPLVAKLPDFEHVKMNLEERLKEIFKQ